MTLGIRMRQAGGVKVIDDRFLNLALITKGTFTTDMYDDDTWGGQGSVSPNRRYVRVTGATNPIMAISNNNTTPFYSGGRGARCRRVDRGGGTFDFYFTVPQDGGAFVVVTPIKYWIFDVTPPNLTGIGFRIRNRLTNAVVFDSRARYMKVLGFISRQATFDYLQDRVWNYAFNTVNLAVVQSTVPLKLFDAGSGLNSMECYTMRTRISGNTVSVDENVEWILFSSGVSPWVPTNKFNMIVIDVTGL